MRMIVCDLRTRRAGERLPWGTERLFTGLISVTRRSESSRALSGTVPSVRGWRVVACGRRSTWWPLPTSVVLSPAPSIVHAACQAAPFPLYVTTPRKRSTRRRTRGTASTQLTSVSTSRTAYAETKLWLIQQHGPVCAYCGRRATPATITLDHVAPRRGQSAYDRRDNLVLACTACNGAKADMPILAFLLRKRERAVMLRRYGAHLSPMLVDLVAALAPAGDAPPRIRERFDELFSDGESPYHESPYRD